MPDQKNFATGPIELKTAQEYINNLEESRHFPFLRNFAGAVFHSGYIQSWKDEQDFEGIFFWLGCDVFSRGIKVIAESKAEFKYDDKLILTYQPNVKSKIVIGTNYFMFSGANSWVPYLNESDFESDKLKADRNEVSPTSDQQSILLEWTRQFMNDVGSSGLCKVPFGYFSNLDADENGNSYLTSFLANPELAFISVHFGYNPKLDPHGLRLILIGRNSSGNPLRNSLQSFEILQINRPPKPTN